MAKNILILGAKGMLGQELVKLFKKDKDYSVTTWDKQELDILNKKELLFKIGNLKPQIIINATGYNAVDKAEEPKEFALAKKLNAEAPKNLAEIAKKIGAVFANYSSDYVFSGQPKIFEPAGCNHSCHSCGLHNNNGPLKIGFDENSKPKPLSNYGKSKLLGEKTIQKIKGKYYIIRTSKIFGKPAKSKNAKKSFFDIMLEMGRKNKTVRVINGELSCFTYAPDLARKTKEIIEARKPFGIYHVFNEGACTWYQAVLELYQTAGLKTKVVPIGPEDYPRPAKRSEISALINTKLNPLRNYKEALREYLRKK